jgi:hypothetical protein
MVFGPAENLTLKKGFWILTGPMVTDEENGAENVKHLRL